MRRRLFNLRRNERGTAVVEFALVVPILFLLVWGTLNFSRAYQRLNILTGALREGARFAATLDPVDQGAVRTRVQAYSASFGYTIDVTQVTAILNVNQVEVSVTNYPLFSDLPFLGLLNTINVTRKAIFRWERAP